jgi:4a-hydroxytetrahydrobiopterin dehydratase
MALSTERCEACRADSPRVTESEQQELKSHIPDWEVVTVNGVPRLKRTFAFEGWMPAVDFANAVARIADEQDHHPSILIQWGKVTVSWWTHAIRGLHRNDFIMAARSDELYKAQSAT